MMKKKYGTTLVLIILALILAFCAIPASAAGYTGWYQYKGAYYYLKENVPAKGWQKISGKWYYLDPSTGAVRTGWLKSNSSWYYLDPQAGTVKTGFVKISGKYYYFSKTDGTLQTGWVKDGNDYYYFNPKTGVIQTGWLGIGNFCYYLHPTTGKAVKKTSHQWDNGVETKTATCTVDGVKTYACSLCGQTRSENILATGHVTTVMPHYALVHYLPPQYVCNKCGAAFPDEDSVGNHILDGCNCGYHVDFYMEDYREDYGHTYIDGCIITGYDEVCAICGQTVGTIDGPY